MFLRGISKSRIDPENSKKARYSEERARLARQINASRIFILEIVVYRLVITYTVRKLAYILGYMDSNNFLLFFAHLYLYIAKEIRNRLSKLYSGSQLKRL